MGVHWCDTISFSWTEDGERYVRVMAIRAAVDLFATFASEKRRSAMIILPAPIDIVPGETTLHPADIERLLEMRYSPTSTAA